MGKLEPEDSSVVRERDGLGGEQNSKPLGLNIFWAPGRGSEVV